MEGDLGLGEETAVILGWQHPDSLPIPPDVFQNLSFPSPGVLLAEGDAQLQPQKSKLPASLLSALREPQRGI